MYIEFDGEGYTWPSGDQRSIDVHESGAKDTGLMDVDGRPIYRLKNPIGFHDFD